jgi:Ger(x)C family germination protein
MRNYKLILVFALTPLFLCGCYKGFVPVENLNIIVGIGNDIDREGSSPYSSTMESLVFKGESQITSHTNTGNGFTLYTTQSNRQTQSNKEWLLAAEVVYLVSEDRAKLGIKDLMDALLRDVKRNEKAFIAISKEPVKDLFSLKPHISSSISEEIEGILEFSHSANFFKENSDIINLLLMNNQQGRKIVIPYIEVKNDEIQVTGLALFKEEKMIKSVSLEEASLINLLRSNGESGYLSLLSNNEQEYIDFSGRGNVKIKASKEGELLKYDIFVTLKGALTINSLIDKDKSLSDKKKIGQLFSEKLEKQLSGEIWKMQNEYKTDWIDLGKYAVAKFGRDSGYESDENFSKAKIDVHVNTKVLSTGRKVDK